MMDIAELERERGDPHEAGKVDPSGMDQEADELAKVRLQRQALTFE